MVELKTWQLASLVSLVAFVTALSTNAVVNDPESTYYCEIRDLVAECSEGLSGSKQSCYYRDADDVKRRKMCTSTRKPVEEFLLELSVNEPVVESDVSSGDCTVTPYGCFDKGFLERPVDCEVCK